MKLSYITKSLCCRFCVPTTVLCTVTTNDDLKTHNIALFLSFHLYCNERSIIVRSEPLLRKSGDSKHCYKVLSLYTSHIGVFYLSFIVSAKKHKYLETSSEEEVDDEHVSFVDTYLDLRGGVRKHFALEAALVDHARNMICSPLSVLMPLGKLTLGAENRAEEELLAALGLKNSKQIKNSFAQLIANLEFLPGVTLDVASRVYISSREKIDKNFMKNTKRIFKSTIKSISVDNPSKTAKSINEWVSSKTRHKIKRLVSASDITRDTSLIMVNAIYFAGSWLNRFGQAYTDEFHSPSGTRRIPMMTRQGVYSYWQCDTLNAQIVEIPYEGRQSSMIIVLPYSNSGLPVLLRALKLAPELLNQALEKMKKADVILSIPKFKIETELDLGSLYRKIGLRSIFDRRNSGLSGIIKGQSVYVSKAIHKAVIEVNEKGTEAAAATDLIVDKLSLLIYEMQANHPFLFYITAFKEQLFAGVFYGKKGTLK